MKRTLVRYTVKPECVAANEQAVAAVFAQLQTEHLIDVRYATYKLDDGVSFMHIVGVETADGSNPIPQLAAFKAFSAGIAERCVAPPVFTEIQEVGFYNGIAL